jgi:hypothetical protein
MPWMETTHPFKSGRKTESPDLSFPQKQILQNLVVFSPNTIILRCDICFSALQGWD